MMRSVTHLFRAGQAVASRSVVHATTPKVTVSSGLVRFVSTQKLNVTADILPNRKEKKSSDYRKVPAARRNVFGLAASTFNGQLVDDKRHGTWTFTNSDGQLFEGEFDQGRIVRGTGVLTDRFGTFEVTFADGVGTGVETRAVDGSVWTGTWVNSMGQGQGTIVWPDGQRYDGAWRNGSMHGQGSLTHSDGSVLEGEFREGDIYNGAGTVHLTDGDSYVGSVARGLWHGQGKLTLGGKLQVGEFREGQLLHGHGTVLYPSGATYSGEYENGNPHGQGRLTQMPGDYTQQGEFKEGYLFNGKGFRLHAGDRLMQGEWKQGLLTGKISILGKPFRFKKPMADGTEHTEATNGIKLARGVTGPVTMYAGGVRQDKKHGFGSLTNGKGDIYEGEWMNDFLHGQGKLRFRNGSMYEGGWHASKFEGQGRLTYKHNGDTYVLQGAFKEGRIFDGRGTYFAPDGSRQEGEWLRGHMTGQGTVTHRDGTVQRGVWTMGNTHVPTTPFVAPAPVVKAQAFVEFYSTDVYPGCSGAIEATTTVTAGECTSFTFNHKKSAITVWCDSNSPDSAWTAAVWSDPTGKASCDGAPQANWSGTGSCSTCPQVVYLDSNVLVNCGGAPVTDCYADMAVVKNDAYYEGKFFEWLTKHKVAVPSGAHFVSMLKNFVANDKKIEEHNAKESTYKLGHNQFSHLTVEEWRAHVKLGLMKKPEVSTAASVHAAPVDVSALPKSVDWTTAGAVTPVKDQGSCGSCWSFSTTGAIEGAYKIKHGSLLSFSEQNFVDCDMKSNGGSDLGCHGGQMDAAFDWAKTWGGVCTEADYPYVSGTTKERGTCNTKCAKNPMSAPWSHTDVQKNSDSALMSALAQQPVSIAIEADQSDFQLYKSGVFTAACGTSLDHGVLAVGYGTLDGTDYYKVKNSWGASWGMDGYILLERGISGQPEGQCGILSGPPSFPNL